jgi:hypothetical protein
MKTAKKIWLTQFFLYQLEKNAGTIYLKMHPNIAE